VNTVVSLAFTAVLMVVTVVMAKRARAKWDRGAFNAANSEA
jgi:hypothetical protein